ncbi:hypothetical protein ACFV5G_15450 [Streptomyces sp. NPDC059766]|uniref:hypothetical protein n=1 Tax=Streptomyces sp. NPDC059766 TaxID=3346940 RepID=UPI00364A1A4A
MARLLLVITATVVLGAGVGTGLWYLTRDPATRPGAAPTVAAPAAGGTAATDETAASADTADTATTPATDATSAPPADPAPAKSPAAPTGPAAPGYGTVRDPVGYSVTVPEGWTRRQKQGELAPVVSYDSPDDGRRLQIFALAESTPAESLDLAEHDPGYGFARQPGYRVLDRRSDTAWSELTYRYDDADGGPRQVIDRRFRAADGTLYAIRSSGPENLAADLVRAPLTTAVASFCPSGARCG